MEQKPGTSPAAARVQRAFELYAARRARDAAFGAAADGFGEPAWDMLLILCVHDGPGGGLTRDTLLDAAGGTRMIAERYLDWLASRELITVDVENGDTVIRLQEHGRVLLQAYFDRETKRCS
ncbi:hypothetical protein ACU5AX_09210 [Sphingomonas sp. XXL09]|uniref:hypothetical protein n=1 Tax=Sphingomonas sp. XXL09 TaxID=3457787 RepID=UPI00406BD294